MGESVFPNGFRAIEAAAGYCRDGPPADIVGRMLPQNWNFAVVASRIWRIKAAAAAHAITGAPERTCRAWASGQSEPPFHVACQLLDSEDGENALAVMLGPAHPIVRKLELANRVLAAVKQFE